LPLKVIVLLAVNRINVKQDNGLTKKNNFTHVLKKSKLQKCHRNCRYV